MIKCEIYIVDLLPIENHLLYASIVELHMFYNYITDISYHQSRFENV